MDEAEPEVTEECEEEEEEEEETGLEAEATREGRAPS
jgi:hypothetical protein